MHERLANEFVFRLARRAAAIVARCLRDDEKRVAFDRFHRAFREELCRYEEERELMENRLKGCVQRPEPVHERPEEQVQRNEQAFEGLT